MSGDRRLLERPLDTLDDLEVDGADDRRQF
jgi:hypothetical protein